MKSLRPSSITVRLVLLVALVAVFASAGVSAYLYRSLATQLEFRDDSELLLLAYRSEVWLAIVLGTLFAASLGYLLVRQGLRSVRSIARQARSITAHKLDTRITSEAAPQELQDMAHAFNAMLDRLHDSFERLNRFSADLAHDLRAPLNNLMIQTQVALRKLRTAEDYQNLLVSNVEEYERLARMIESILFLARAENANAAVSKEILDANTELQRIAEYFEGIAEDAGVKITVAGEGFLHANAILLRRAVSNLAANAIRHTAKGETVRLRAQASANALLISVSNPGSGIEQKHIPHLFKRFYRADPARIDSAGSSGLGLAIVQSIMEAHAGTAEATSDANGLTIFTLTFPFSTTVEAA